MQLSSDGGVKRALAPVDVNSRSATSERMMTKRDAAARTEMTIRLQTVQPEGGVKGWFRSESSKMQWSVLFML